VATKQRQQGACPGILEPLVGVCPDRSIEQPLRVVEPAQSDEHREPLEFARVLGEPAVDGLLAAWHGTAGRALEGPPLQEVVRPHEVHGQQGRVLGERDLDVGLASPRVIVNV
jgi:hypothetical protein